MSACVYCGGLCLDPHDEERPPMTRLMALKILKKLEAWFDQGGEQDDADAIHYAVEVLEEVK